MFETWIVENCRFLQLETKNDFRDSYGSTLLHQLMDRIGDNLWGIQRPDDMGVGCIGYSEQDKLIGLFWDAILNDREHYNIDLNMQDNFGNTPLHVAANFWPSSKHLEIMLTHFDNIDPYKRDCKGNTFLHIYFFRHSIRDGTELDARLLNATLPYLSNQTLKELLKCQNDILNSPLHVFIKEKNNNINNHNLDRIIAAGGDVNMCDAAGDTVLHCALKSYYGPEDEIFDETNIEMSENELDGKVENIKCLIRNGSDIGVRNKKGDSVLFLAYHKKTVTTLLQLGADVNAKNNLEQTPLMSFVCRQSTDLEVIQAFLAAGADVHSVDIHGSNVLHYIAWYGKYTTVPPCLNIDKLKISTDKLGQRPFDVAYSRGHGDLFYELYTGQVVLQDDHFRLQKQMIEFSDLLKGNLVEFQNICSHLKHFKGQHIDKLLNLPSFGLVSFESESDLVKTAISDMVMRICKKIENRHSLFSIELLQSGSVGENTKVCVPDEFDYLCIFNKLGEICCIDEQKSLCDPGYVYLKLRDELNISEFEHLFNSDRYLDTSKVRSMIQDALDNMSTLHDIFCHPLITFAGDESRGGAETPTIQFSVRWNGCMYKNLKIDIDLVPACQIHKYWPSNARLDLLQCNVNDLEREGAILMLQTALDEDYIPYSKQRISALKAERAHLNSLPRTAFDAYVICKILCNNRICPALKRGRDFEAKDMLTSYMLKNCMFHVVENKSRLTEKTYNKNTELFQLVLDIFRKMLDFAKSENLPSFVFPDQNIFTFNRMEELTNLKVDCSLRCVFLKMILHILGDIQDFSDIDTSMWNDSDEYEDEVDYFSD